MWLCPRLAWKRWRLRHQPVPGDGWPLSDAEASGLETAAFALIDEEGTRRVATEDEASSLVARAVLGMETS